VKNEKVYVSESKGCEQDLSVSNTAVLPELPEHTKAAIKALVHTCNSETK
jgi:hypothetical protein